MRNELCEATAKKAAAFLSKKLKIQKGKLVGIILGTGWGGQLHIENAKSIPFDLVPGFTKLAVLEGHNRRFVYGTVSGKSVIALQGRIHLNEDPSNPNLCKLVRLQTEILMQLGVKRLVTTCAAGALIDVGIKVGDLVVINGFMTLFAPPMPLFAGEFVSPEDALSKELIRIASLKNKRHYGGNIRTGGYAMLLGPYFEGRIYDKMALTRTGASLVGMSTLPEVCIAALYNVEVLALAFITNSASEVHSHGTNMKKAAQFSSKLGTYLSSVIKDI